jgi:putative ABC transport system permease protein
MFDRDNWQEIFSTIKKNKLRTTLTAFGVFWGIFMLVIMLGSGNGLRNGVISGFDGFATNSFFMWTQKTNKAFAGFQPGRRFNYNNEDTEAIRSSVPEAQYVCARNQLGGFRGGNNITRGVKTGQFSIYGDFPEFNKIEPKRNLRGRFINDKDIAEKRKVAVIGNRVQEILFEADEDPIGQYIRINGVYFQVVGLFKTKQSGGQGQEESQTVHVPFTTFQTAFNFGNIVGWYAITSKENIPVEIVENKVIELMKTRHHIAPDDNLAIGHWNMGKEFDKISGLFNGIDLLVWIVGIGTLLAGIIGVSNIMLIVVKERTKEIGIKRALGATPIKIVGQIILESVFLTTFAGYFGLVFGIGILESVNMLLSASPDSGMFKNPEVDLNIAITALTVLIVAGALAGFIPARRAIQVKPIEALRADG